MINSKNNTVREVIAHILPETQTFSNVSAKFWNSLTGINANVTFIKFKESLKLYLTHFLLITLNNHTLTIMQFSCSY